MKNDNKSLSEHVHHCKERHCLHLNAVLKDLSLFHFTLAINNRVLTRSSISSIETL